MLYTLTDFVWLFFLYSFAGWCIEVCCAAVRRRKFVNRGFVNSPLCPIYGFGSVLFGIFLPELTGEPFFLFLGGMLLASVLEYATGMAMEKIFRKKLWDYSDIRFNLSGYICARYCLLWGALALLTMLVTNPLLCGFFRLIPRPVTLAVQWTAVGLFALDFITTAMAVLNMKVTARQFAQLSAEMQHTSRLLENRLTAGVQKRMQKSFPSLSTDTLAADIKVRSEQAAEKNKVFAEGCSFYKLVSLFFIGAFLGDITETIFCLLTTGILMSRSSVVYGPFSIVWGLGCALLTLFLYRYRNKSDRYIFMAGTFLGGAYEYVCSVFTELVFGTVFWDYSGFAFNLGGRINLLYCFFWGIAAVVWLKMIYPLLSGLVEKIPPKAGKLVCNCMIVFMIFNMILSSLALARYTERNTVLSADGMQTAIQDTAADGEVPAEIPKETPAGNGMPDETAPGTEAPDAVPGGGISAASDNARAVTPLEAFLDSHFPDERMERIYPNAKMVQ